MKQKHLILRIMALVIVELTFILWSVSFAKDMKGVKNRSIAIVPIPPSNGSDSIVFYIPSGIQDIKENGKHLIYRHGNQIYITPYLNSSRVGATFREIYEVPDYLMRDYYYEIFSTTSDMECNLLLQSHRLFVIECDSMTVYMFVRDCEAPKYLSILLHGLFYPSMERTIHTILEETLKKDKDDTMVYLYQK